MTQHYVGMAGLRGYLPNFCELYDSFESACESLIDMHDVGWEMVEEDVLPMTIEAFEGAEEDLHEFGSADIDLHIHGNEYMQVTECFCDAPWEHSGQTTQEVLEYLGLSEKEVLEALENEDNDKYIRQDLKDYLNSLEAE